MQVKHAQLPLIRIWEVVRSHIFARYVCSLEKSISKLDLGSFATGLILREVSRSKILFGKKAFDGRLHMLPSNSL